MHVFVTPKRPADLKALVDGLRRLAKSDSLALVEEDPSTGQWTVAGTGEEHLRALVATLAATS